MKEGLKVGMIAGAIFLFFYFGGLGNFLGYYFRIGTPQDPRGGIVSIGMAIFFVITYYVYGFFVKKQVTEQPKDEEKTTAAQKIVEKILWIAGIISLIILFWMFMSFNSIY